MTPTALCRSSIRPMSWWAPTTTSPPRTAPNARSPAGWRSCAPSSVAGAEPPAPEFDTRAAIRRGSRPWCRSRGGGGRGGAGCAGLRPSQAPAGGRWRARTRRCRSARHPDRAIGWCAAIAPRRGCGRGPRRCRSVAEITARRDAGWAITLGAAEAVEILDRFVERAYTADSFVSGRRPGGATGSPPTVLRRRAHRNAHPDAPSAPKSTPGLRSGAGPRPWCGSRGGEHDDRYRHLSFLPG